MALAISKDTIQLQIDSERSFTISIGESVFMVEDTIRGIPASSGELLFVSGFEIEGFRTQNRTYVVTLERQKTGGAYDVPASGLEDLIEQEVISVHI